MAGGSEGNRGGGDSAASAKPTDSIGHLVPAEVEVRGVGLDHRCGAVERTNFLVVANICDRK